MAANAVTAPSQASNSYRWMQLIVGLICMAMMANLQYGWTYFVGPMAKAHQWEVGSIQVAFSIFIALETWLTPLEGWIVDSIGVRGPKFMVAFGGIAAALGWFINSKATSLEALYVGAAISGIGAGGVYATCVGNAVKWFPDRRGLAVGLTAAGFGAGAVLTVIPIQRMIASIGYADTFFWFALIQGGVVFVLAWLLRAPMPGEAPAATAVKVVKTSSRVGRWVDTRSGRTPATSRSSSTRCRWVALPSDGTLSRASVRTPPSNASARPASGEVAKSRSSRMQRASAPASRSARQASAHDMQVWAQS